MLAEARAGTRATVRDLLRTARAREKRPGDRGVPLLLAVTVLVETLAALREAGRNGRRIEVTAENVLVNAPSLEALLDDPTRDPKIELADAVAAMGEAPDEEPATPDLYGAGAVFHELLAGVAAQRGFSTLPAFDGLPAAADRLLRGLLAPHPEDRPGLEDALTAARALGIELLGAWDEARRPGRLEADLRLALESRNEPDVRRLAAALADVAPDSPWVARAHGWMEVRSRKAREEAIRTRLEQLAESEKRQREAARRVSLKLILTGAPLVFAAFLTGLLAVVVWLSG